MKFKSKLTISIFSAFIFCLFISHKQLSTSYKLLRYYYIPRYQLSTGNPIACCTYFRAHADYVLDHDFNTLVPKKVKSGEIVYVDSGFLERFFTSLYPDISEPFILLTHRGDESVPGPFWPYLKDKKLVAWFGQNIDYKGFNQYQDCINKLYHVPIGLISHNAPFKRAKVQLPSLRKRYNNNAIKEKLLYLNSHQKAHPDRPLLYTLFNNQEFCTTIKNPTKPYFDYIDELGRHKFVLSPHGLGLDCYRTWETLYLGGIPIVKNSSLDPLYKDLPVVIVKDWNEVTKEFLEKKWEELEQKDFETEKMCRMHHWIDKIKVVQQKIINV